MPELDERKRIIDYDTVNDPDENYYVLADNGTEGTGKVNVKKIGPGNMISDAYSDQDTYAVGDVCIHNNILYVCNTEIDTPHAFDLSEWDPDTLGNYCSNLNGDVSEIKSSLSNLIKTTKITGSTDASGNIGIGSTSTRVITEVYPDRTVNPDVLSCFLTITANGATFMAKCVNANLQAVARANVAVWVVYKDI